MKGLILKDLYMIKAYCKAYIFIVAVFLGVSFFGENSFFTYYPCLICGMIPVNLLAYDERSKFIQYGASLPVSRAQTVSEKYIIGLLTQFAVVLITGTVQAIKMIINNVFDAGSFTIMLISLFIVSVLASSISLPFIFKSGVEKGRIAYYVMIGFVCGTGVIFSEIFNGVIQIKLPPALIFALLFIVSAVLYCSSWLLSVRFYKKREL